MRERARPAEGCGTIPAQASGDPSFVTDVATQGPAEVRAVKGSPGDLQSELLLEHRRRAWGGHAEQDVENALPRLAL